jgi:hypothetical protein
MDDTVAEFKQNLSDVGIPTVDIDKSEDKIYIHAPESGWGIPEDCYNGVDARLIESIGMSSLSESHKLYSDTAHHILIFKVQ